MDSAESPFPFDRFLVILVAVLASLEAFGEAAESLIGGRLLELLVWWLICMAMVAGTYFLEILKSRGRA